MFQVMVDKTEVVFDEIRFLESVTRTIAIANTGQVLLTLIKQFYNTTVFFVCLLRMIKFHFGFTNVY